MRHRVGFLLVATVSVLLVLSAGARADIALLPGNVPQPGEVNVLLNNGTSGTTVTGTTTPVAFTVDFTSTQTLVEPSTGLARITGDSTGLTNITTALAGGLGFGDMIFNVYCNTCDAGMLTISGSESFGGATETFSFGSLTVGNGDNFFTLVASNGQLLTSITVTTQSGSFTDLRQIRLSGLPSPPAVPEPASLLLLGTGLMGVVGARRRMRNR